MQCCSIERTQSVEHPSELQLQSPDGSAVVHNRQWKVPAWNEVIRMASR